MLHIFRSRNKEQTPVQPKIPAPNECNINYTRKAGLLYRAVKAHISKVRVLFVLTIAVNLHRTPKKDKGTKSANPSRTFFATGHRLRRPNSVPLPFGLSREAMSDAERTLFMTVHWNQSIICCRKRHHQNSEFHAILANRSQ